MPGSAGSSGIRDRFDIGDDLSSASEVGSWTRVSQPRIQWIIDRLSFCFHCDSHRNLLFTAPLTLYLSPTQLLSGPQYTSEVANSGFRSSTKAWRNIVWSRSCVLLGDFVVRLRMWVYICSLSSLLWPILPCTNPSIPHHHHSAQRRLTQSAPKQV